jgi:hypothetical protein
MTKEGNYQIVPIDIKKDVQYEFRAVIIHPRVKIYGDVKRFSN